MAVLRGHKYQKVYTKLPYSGQMLPTDQMTDQNGGMMALSTEFIQSLKEVTCVALSLRFPLVLQDNIARRSNKQHTSGLAVFEDISELGVITAC